MLHRMISRLGVKMAAAFALVMLLAAAALIAVSTDLAVSLGEQAADRGAHALRVQAHGALQRTTRQQTERYGALFGRTAALSRIMAGRAADLLAMPARPGAEPALHPADSRAMLTNGPDAPASVVYFGGRAMPAATRRVLARLAPLDPLLRRARQEAYSARAAWFSSVRPFVRYAPNLPLIDELPKGFDGREGRYYRVAAPDNNPGRKTRWTEVYQDPAGQGLMASVATPVYGPDDTFRGVAGIDVTLNAMVERLLERQRTTLGGETIPADAAFSFLVDDRGRLIAFPPDRLGAFGLDAPADLAPGESLDHTLLDSDVPGVRRAVRSALADAGRAVTRLSLDGAPYLLATHRMPETGWVLGNVVSEKAVLGGVRAARRAIDSDVAAMTRDLSGITIGLLVLTLLAVTGYAMAFLVRPLRTLAGAARRVRTEGPGVEVALERNDELGQVAVAFNGMSRHLADLVADLEGRVAARTRDLEAARDELAVKNAELERTNGALMDSLTCASRLQVGLLPEADATVPLDDHFVLWRPRDVVGGDLYVARDTANGLYLGVIDCTGHGVPGALMTMGAYAAFGHALAHTGAGTPGAVLTEMSRYMNEMLTQGAAGALDHGLVMGLVRWQPGADTLAFAGGGIDLLAADPGAGGTDDPEAAVATIKGGRGGLGQRQRDPGRPFTDRTVPVPPGRAFYLASDGFTDQIGGPQGIAFGPRRLRRLAGGQAGRPMADQKAAFEAALADWQGDETQRDDITVLAFRPRSGLG